VAWGGVALMGGGLVLRVWAARVLGAFYTRTLRTSAGQRVVAEGPYRLVRHPDHRRVPATSRKHLASALRRRPSGLRLNMPPPLGSLERVDDVAATAARPLSTS
jgi:Isoprenylcysteine carboxyl methyltransferase (ICMT) family